MKNVFDTHYRKYDKWYDEYPAVFLSEIKAIKKVLPASSKGLEIGVGTGRFAASLGIECGIDPSEKMAMKARERGVDARSGVGENLPFADNTFGYVAIINTLCFVKNPLTVLKEAKRVLKQRARIVIGIIDKNSFLGRFYQTKKSLFYKQAHFFSVDEVTRLLKDAGFSRFSYYQTLFSFPEENARVEKTYKGFGRGGFVVIGARS